jgi:lathosterol oxidase
MLMRSRFLARPTRPTQLRRDLMACLSSLAILSAAWPVMRASDRLGLKIEWSGAWTHSSAWYVISFLLMVVLYDAYFYWTHRLMHASAWLRHKHMTHHRANDTLLQAFAFSPVEAVVHAAFGVVLNMLLPLHDNVIGGFTIFVILMTLYGHSSVELFPRSWVALGVTKWFNATTHHHMHHVDGRSNFGIYFPFWDRVAKTENRAYASTLEGIVENHASISLRSLRRTTLLLTVEKAVTIGAR